MSTLLFFDDWNLHARVNMSRHVGRAELVPEGTFADPYVNPSWGYPTVVRDPNSGIWRCMYQGQVGPRNAVPVMAESSDGVHWEAPDLAERGGDFKRHAPHQLFELGDFWEWSGPYADPRAVGTDEWLKGLVVDRGPREGERRPRMVASPDGERWHELTEGDWHRDTPDPVSFVYWNPYRQSHVFSARPRPNDRRICVYETSDWREFSSPELALQADALDSPCAEIYGMPVIEYEGMFIGLLWMYHTDPEVKGTNKYLLGQIDCQIAYSLNGWHFQRGLRDPLISGNNWDSGSDTLGCIYPYSVVRLDNEIRIYSSASNGEHAHTRGEPEKGRGVITLHTLRPDGFVYLASDGGAGHVSTRLLRWLDGEPTLNVRAPAGEVRAQICDINGDVIPGYAFDDCRPFRGDSLDWIPRWQSDRTLARLSGRIIRLQLEVSNGALYAIRGDFDVVMSGEAQAYEDFRTPIVTRPGL